MTWYGQVVIDAIEGNRTILIAESILRVTDTTGGACMVTTPTAVIRVVGKCPVCNQPTCRLGWRA